MNCQSYIDWKSKIYNGALRFLPQASSYRANDVLDYVCEHLDLDKNIDDFIEKVAKREYEMTLEEMYNKDHNDEKLEQLVAEEIIRLMETKIKEGIY